MAHEKSNIYQSKHKLLCSSKKAFQTLTKGQLATANSNYESDDVLEFIASDCGLYWS
jgi:hypothetical protein